MFRIVRTSALRAALDREAELRGELAAAKTQADLATDAAIRAENVAEELQAALARHAADVGRSEGELETLRAQTLLDTEDRAALRMLLRIARKQNRADRVYALFRRGALHSVHATLEAAEAAAEAEGAPRSGWTSHAPGGALPPAAEAAWRVQPLPLGGAG